ncbi:MAG: hypothetical protein ACP5DZ_00230 [Bacteroidales bacterium]
MDMANHLETIIYNITKRQALYFFGQQEHIVSGSACYLLHCLVFFALLWAGVSPSLCPAAQKITMQHSRIYGSAGLRNKVL